VSDTPRTDDRTVIIDGNQWVNAPFARQLERELNAANVEIERLKKSNLQLREGAEEQKQRIKRLEAGDAALTYSIALDLQKENDALKQRIKRLEKAGDELIDYLKHRIKTDHLNPIWHTASIKWGKSKEAKL
jgi:predicted RNase H-like nuclease (RuvC/YqgF family)